MCDPNERSIRRVYAGQMLDRRRAGGDRATEISFGPIDSCSLQILRDALLRDTTQLCDFVEGLGSTSAVVLPRLNSMVESGLMEVTENLESPGHSAYVLTDMGRALEQSIISLTIWDLRWRAPREDPDLVYALEDREALVRPADQHVEDHAPLVIEIDLLGTFAVRIGRRTLGSLSSGSQRLLAFLALQDRAVARIAMAGAMWPETSDRAAGISLRSALARLDVPTRAAILVASGGLRLADAVVVDLANAQAMAHRLLHSGDRATEADLSAEATVTLSTELLPDWYDDWVIAEAEDWRQLRVSALEAQAGSLCSRGRLPEAAGAARAAIRVDPLRESAQARLIEVHLAKGNQSDALRVFDRYRTLLSSELGLEPTPHLNKLIEGIRKP
jgi:DNA-binding SARP family transcriptional activator/DNA-binding HxlR family transcriptional regulator